MARIKKLDDRHFITFGARYGVYNRYGLLVARFLTRAEAEKWVRENKLK